MRKRFLNGMGKDWLHEYRAETKYIADIYSGYASLIRIDKVSRRLEIPTDGGMLCIGDDGYRWLTFLPDNSHWCMTAIYNQAYEIVEWYFDMTKENGVDAQGNPYQDDLFLDVVLSPDGKITVLDEDELQEALDCGDITRQEYDMAHEVCCVLIRDFLSAEHAVRDFCGRCLAQFS